MSKLKVTQVKSLIGQTQRVRRVAQALGLRKNNITVEHNDTPIIRGMLRKVSHLVTVES